MVEARRLSAEDGKNATAGDAQLPLEWTIRERVKAPNKSAGPNSDSESNSRQPKSESSSNQARGQIGAESGGRGARQGRASRKTTKKSGDRVIPTVFIL